ncbi:MAG: universal stress protein [Prosthecochloris sp.]|uniref:universal stress protein n=1 Tax=Prosthecochloris sp. TaxID=290513 RepID=UPI0013CD79B5|nr:universal stress protein [Prosthecochloris sp.]NEX11092.1 universal stress protein [Prosthecochloris sp.]
MMSNTLPDTLSIKRITVALDGSSHSKASLSIATDIARALNAEINGIYVEDINLLRMASLPFAEEIDRLSGRREPVDSAGLERSLQLQARQAGQMLRQAAERFRLAHSFRTLRGQVAAQVLAEALSSDLLVLGKTGKTPVCRKKMGTTAKAVITSGTTSILLMRSGFSIQEPLLVLFDGSHGAAAALVTTAAIADKSTHIHVLLIANSPEKAEKLKESAKTLLPPTCNVTFHETPWTDIAMLLQCIGMIGSGLVVASDTEGTLSKESMHELIEKLDYPVLLIRKSTQQPLP